VVGFVPPEINPHDPLGLRRPLLRPNFLFCKFAACYRLTSSVHATEPRIPPTHGLRAPREFYLYGGRVFLLRTGFRLTLINFFVPLVKSPPTLSL